MNVMLSLAQWISTLGGVGYAPKMPGTFGSLMAIPMAWLWIRWQVSPGFTMVLWSIGFGLGCWASQRWSTALGSPDPKQIVIDEWIALWGVLLLVPYQAVWWVSAFVLFRILDITKPTVIGWADRHIKGGLGIMLDDLLAAIGTVLILHAVHLVVQWFF